jgi:hypothetical protein
MNVYKRQHTLFEAKNEYYEKLDEFNSTLIFKLKEVTNEDFHEHDAKKLTDDITLSCLMKNLKSLILTIDDENSMTFDRIRLGRMINKFLKYLEGGLRFAPSNGKLKFF